VGGAEVSLLIAEVLASGGGRRDVAAARAVKEQLTLADRVAVGDLIVTRRDVEDIVRSLLEPAVDAVRRTVASAGLNMHDVDSILLAGGSARMPVVREVLIAATALPVHLASHPEHAVARGAARTTIARR
jgi:molecular chaperone DnaK (HSP70)